LLLDELVEMPVGTQAKLLRVLEERKLRAWERVPSRRSTCACWLPPNTIRKRLSPWANCARPSLPAQRLPHSHGRRCASILKDLPAMAEAMLAEMNLKHGRRVPGVAPSMLDRMMAYDWPGNGPASCAIPWNGRSSFARTARPSMQVTCLGALARATLPQRRPWMPVWFPST